MSEISQEQLRLRAEEDLIEKELMIKNANEQNENENDDIDDEVGNETDNPIPIPRESWSNKTEYLLALVGLIIGFGNIWRFPYLLQKNGGAAFLIPCMVFLLVAGIPIFFLELAIGQRMRRGAIGSWNSVSPYLMGIGISAGFVCVLVSLYYNTLFAWCISYFVWSWTFPDLIWSQCQNLSYQTEEVLYHKIGPDQFHMYVQNVTSASQECELAGPAKYYWYRETLDISNDINEIGHWNWYMMLWMIISWLAVCLCLIKGTESSGKVTYITSTMPYVVLLIFFIGGFFLEDFSEGFKILFTPHWSKLLEGKVWLDAGSQIFFALNLGFGIITTFASYEPTHNNCATDAYVVPIISFLTSIFSTCVMFEILGFKGMKEFKQCLAHRNETIYSLIDVYQILSPEYLSKNWSIQSLNYPHDHFISHVNATLVHKNGTKLIANVWGSKDNEDNLIYAHYCDKETIIKNTGSGTGLIFITFAEAVISFPASQLFAIIFFLMMMALGIDSAFGQVEGVISCIVDLKLFNCKKWVLVVIVNATFMVVTVFLFSTGNSMYILIFFDELCTGYPLLIVAMCECIGIAYVYGLDKFSYEIKLMTGVRPNAYLLLCWKFISPASILIILIFSLVYQLDEGLVYPRWRKDLGISVDKNWDTLFLGFSIAIVIFTIAWMPLIAILVYFGVRILKDPKEKFPEEELKEIRNYDEEKDHISSLQTVMMSNSSLKDIGKMAINKSIRRTSGDDDNDKSSKSTMMNQVDSDLIQAIASFSEEEDDNGDEIGDKLILN